MKSWCTAVVAALAFGLGISVGPARAEISVKEAGFAGGVLVVRGETGQASQRVTLDDRYVERTNRLKEFTFRIRYLPRDCMVAIKAGTETYNAVVSNCDAAAGGIQRSRVPDGSGVLPANSEAPAQGTNVLPSTGTKGDSVPHADDFKTENAKGDSTAISERGLLRVVRQPCERGGECRVICRAEEIALNAYCTRGSARLLNERTVSCAAKKPSRIVAYCMGR